MNLSARLQRGPRWSARRVALIIILKMGEG